MARVFFISDTHLGHRAIGRYRDQIGPKGPESVVENTELITQCWKSLVSTKLSRAKQDVVWCLGDMAFDEEHTKIIRDLPGRKFLAIGNHEYLDKAALCETYEKIFGILSHYKCWISHAPIHPAELYGKVNIHGHVHEKTIPHEQYINVSVDALMLNFGKPMIDLDELRAYMVMAKEGKVKIGPHKNYEHKANKTPS